MPTKDKPFKDFLDAAAVARLGALLAEARPTWDAAGFTLSATDGLEALELKDRVRHVAHALQKHLDPDYTTAVAHVRDCLPQPASNPQTPPHVFAFWPLCQWVEDAGIEYWELSMNLMRELTSRFSCEFAVRPFLIRYQDRTVDQLRNWASDPDQHVRRWVSEGTRPRLPWGQQLRALVADPTPVLELLELLKGDAEEYVRRSVANNLNDIAKDHPDLVVATTARWMKDADKNRQRLVKHALRSLVKQGHAGALKVLGYGLPEVELVALGLSDNRVAFGTKLEITLALKSTSKRNQPLIIDYAVHHMKANGTLTPKVFKWSTRTLAAGKTLKLTRKHAIKAISTRRYYNGEHRVLVLVNGIPLGTVGFVLEGAEG